MSVRRLPTHIDDRGMLVVAEDADVGFPIRRVFAVTGSPAGTVRGDHVVPCRQTMMLVAGGATIRTAADAGSPTAEQHLREPGDAVDLEPGVWVQYTLSGPDAVVVVFAEAPFQPRGGRGPS